MSAIAVMFFIAGIIAVLVWMASRPARPGADIVAQDTARWFRPGPDTPIPPGRQGVRGV